MKRLVMQTFKNEDEQQMTLLLYKLIGASCVAFLLSIFINMYSKDWKGISVALGGILLQILPFCLLRRGYLRVSSFFVSVSLLGTLTIFATVGQGIRDVVIVAVPIVYYFARISLNRSIFILCVGLSLVAAGWLALGQTYGWFVPLAFGTQLWIDFLLVMIIFLISAFAVDLMITNIHNSLELARNEISQRKLLEETLRESEQRYRFLANNIPDIIYSLDGEGKIVAVNSSAFERYGYTEQDAKGKAFLYFVHPEDQGILINSFLKALEDKRKITTGIKFRIVAENGTSYWFELHARARFDSDGSYLGEEGVLRDITDRRQMEEELLRTQKLESLGVLAGGIAHDFNNLMAVVHGYIGLALTDLPADHDASQKLLKALRSVAQTKDLTGKLITFSSGGSPRKEIFDVAKILRDAVQSKTTGQEVKVIFNLIDNLWKAKVDELQLRQCFYNLTTNAQDAMPKGGTLTVSAENALITAGEVPDLQEGSYLKITFADNGVGIPAELHAKIFDPYFTTKEMSAQKGAGLGLAVCYAILKNHNGCIAVESKPGKGASFVLYFPAQ